MILAKRLFARNLSRRFLPIMLLLAGVCCVSCAPKHPSPQEPGTHAHPDAVWQRFLQNFPKGGTSPAFSLEASLHYLGAENKTRVILEFWGNLDYPLRLDLKTGLGSTLTMWREDANEFMAFVPDKESAYMHKDGRSGMAAFGVNLPFTLRQLGLLLNGRWQGFIPENYTTVRRKNGEGLLFSFRRDSRDFWLLLDDNGIPKALRTPGQVIWDLDFSGSLADDGFPNLPGKISMRCENGDRAILIVKELKQRQTPWTERELDLQLPEDTRMYILKDVQDPTQVNQ